MQLQLTLVDLRTGRFQLAVQITGCGCGFLNGGDVRTNLLQFLTAGKHTVIFLLRERTELQFCRQHLHSLLKLLCLGTGCIRFSGFLCLLQGFFQFGNIVLLKLQKRIPCFFLKGLQLLQFGTLCLTCLYDLLDRCPKSILHRGQFVRRYGAAAGGALIAGLELAALLLFLLILAAQLTYPGVDLRGGLRILRRVDRCFSSGQLLRQCKDAFIRGCRYLPLICQITITSTEICQFIVQRGNIHAGKLLAFQCLFLVPEGILLFPQLPQGGFAVLLLGGGHILLPGEVQDVVFQLPNGLPQLPALHLRREQRLIPQGFHGGACHLRQNVLLGERRQIPLEKVLAIAAQFFDKVQRIEDGQEHVPLSEEISEIHLPHLTAIIGDGHTVALTGAGQLMERPIFIHKAHADEQIRIILIVETVNAALSEEGQTGNSKGDGVRDAALAASVAARNDGGIAEGQVGGLTVGLEALHVQCRDPERFEFFHQKLSFLMRRPSAE